MFIVEQELKKFGPGDPMARDRFSMGHQLGSNITILYREFGDITSFEVVDMKTGDTLFIKVK